MIGLFHWLEASPEKRQKSYDTGSYLVQQLREVAIHGKPCIVTGRFMREGWEFQYNPEKRETPESQLERYLEHLKYAGVGHQYDFMKDEYYFYKREKI
jgi:hypothetical protein